MGTPADTSPPPPSPAHDPAEELAVGTVVGDYVIERMIGFGGMGVVYGALHPVIGKRAAIKVLSAKHCADHAAVARFVQEAQAVNRVGHANIVDIFAFGTLDDGRSYLAMEWLQGETLIARLDRVNRLPVAEAVQITVELARALEAAHAANVIHRDLKPENVILVSEDDGFRIKLLDFGIAKLSTAHPSSSVTATGITMGTPLFMSPEQARGQNVDARTDLYSLGILMYQMLCGETPFEHEASPVEVLHAHISKVPRPPSELEPSIPEALERLVLALLSKRAEDRPSLAEVRRILRQIVAPRGSTSGIVDVPFRDSRELAAPRSGRTKWLAAAALGAVTLGVVVFLVVRRTGTAAEPPPATPPSAAPASAPPPAAVATVEPKPAAKPPAVGTIVLGVDPVDATVTLDGKPIELDHGQIRIDADPGAHAMTFRATGYHPIDRTVSIVSSEATPLVIHLQRLRTVPTKRPPRDTDAVVNPFSQKPKK